MAERPATGWVVERGVGEDRAALIVDGAIQAIRVDPLDDRWRVGEVAAVRLVEGATVPGLTLARSPDGRELLVRGADAPLGATRTVRVVRETVPERGRAKRALAVPDDGSPTPAPSLADELSARTLSFHGPDELEAAGWSERLEEAATGELVRPGCTLRLHLTPAMTLIDVDGTAPADALALIGAGEAAAAIQLFDLGGSIGVDLPTMGSKAARRAVDDLLERRLPRPFERTAANGFGFVQVVRPRPRASSPEQVAADPVGHAVRAALRRAEREPVGPLDLTLSAAGAERLADEPGWRAELERRRGSPVAVRVG